MIYFCGNAQSRVHLRSTFAYASFPREFLFLANRVLQELKISSRLQISVQSRDAISFRQLPRTGRSRTRGVWRANLTAGPPSSSTPFDISNGSARRATWPRFRRPRLPPVPSNLRAPSYHPRRHLDRQLRDEMHRDRAEALITPIADSYRQSQPRKNQPTLRDLMRRLFPSLSAIILVSASSLPCYNRTLSRWSINIRDIEEIVSRFASDLTPLCERSFNLY